MNKAITRISKEILTEIFHKIFLDFPNDCKIINHKIDWKTDCLELKLESEIFNKKADCAEMPLSLFTMSSEISKEKNELINDKNKEIDDLRYKINDLRDKINASTKAHVQLINEQLEINKNLTDENIKLDLMRHTLKHRSLISRIRNADS